MGISCIFLKLYYRFLASQHASKMWVRTFIVDKVSLIYITLSPRLLWSWICACKHNQYTIQVRCTVTQLTLFISVFMLSNYLP